MSNGLTFDMLHIILRNFQGKAIRILLKKDLRNRLIIDREINEKHELLVSCVLSLYINR